ncbi:MAG: hypothetical protein DMG30_10835 [Acidobacteria bacterium]|nr:MAG: hypothetical protein DMG30_10835 [Acidobacteriota bacterium]
MDSGAGASVLAIRSNPAPKSLESALVLLFLQVNGWVLSSHDSTTWRTAFPNLNWQCTFYPSVQYVGKSGQPCMIDFHAAYIILFLPYARMDKPTLFSGISSSCKNPVRFVIDSFLL